MDGEAKKKGGAKERRGEAKKGGRGKAKKGRRGKVKKGRRGKGTKGRGGMEKMPIIIIGDMIFYMFEKGFFSMTTLRI